MKLQRVKDLEHEFPVKLQTLYRWNHERRFPKLFKKFGGALCLDLDELETALKNDEMFIRKTSKKEV